MKSRRMRAGGFTLLEVLLVIAILGVLAGTVAFVLGGTPDKANEDLTRTLVNETVPDAIERYKLHTKDYPASLEALVRDPGVTGWAGPYLKAQQLNDAWGTPLVYSPNSGGNPPYSLMSAGKSKRQGGGTDIMKEW